MNKNKYVNKLLKEEGKNKLFILERYGKCNPKKCMAACCRFKHIGSEKTKSYNGYFSDFMHFSEVQRRRVNGEDHYISPMLCPDINIDGSCKLHGKKEQPRLCKYFPMTPEDGMYRIVKHVCGYKFRKVRNENYVKKKKLVRSKASNIAVSSSATNKLKEKKK